MIDALERLGVSALVFASTNVDDILLLAAFFADPRMRPRAVVAGQFLGIGTLVAASAIVALAALVVPDGYPALLGVVPLALGVKKLVELRRGDAHEDDDLAQRAITSCASQIVAVAGVTIANGGDNLGVYVPLFAHEPAQIPFYGAVFAVLTALWCYAGFYLVRHRAIGALVRRFGRGALPFVLIALGSWILCDARVLLD